MVRKNLGQRQLRVGEELRHALSLLIERTNFRDPDLIRVLVTVTEVRVSPDLRNALVFVVPLGGGDSVRLAAGLKRVRPFLRHALGHMVQLQFMPDLSFRPDNCFETASHIERILRQPKVQRDLQTSSIDVTLQDVESGKG